jgi:GntR family transcriptional regulator
MSDQITRSQKLHEKLGRLIAETNPGEKLLTEPALAQQLGVSRATLREAMRTFETQGLIRRRQGSGTFVIHPPHVLDSGLEVLESIESLAKRNGMQVEMGALQIEHRPATDEEAKALSLDPEAHVVRLSRVIMAGGSAAAYLVDVLPDDILTPTELESGFTGSVLDLLLKRGDPPLDISRTEINSVTASSQVARAMGIQRGDVLLRFTAYLFATSGRVVDYSFSYFLPGYFRFHVVRRVNTISP